MLEERTGGGDRRGRIALLKQAFHGGLFGVVAGVAPFAQFALCLGSHGDDAGQGLRPGERGQEAFQISRNNHDGLGGVPGGQVLKGPY